MSDVVKFPNARTPIEPTGAERPAPEQPARSGSFGAGANGEQRTPSIQFNSETMARLLAALKPDGGSA